ncbi:MAG: flagellar biosynthetic protein FliO [Pirellulaceae bacterium]|nr:flagellar biosynthetic protein FliO [Pirellulaceae bacterium]
MGPKFLAGCVVTVWSLTLADADAQVGPRHSVSPTTNSSPATGMREASIITRAAQLPEVPGRADSALADNGQRDSGQLNAGQMNTGLSDRAWTASPALPAIAPPLESGSASVAQLQTNVQTPQRVGSFVTQAQYTSPESEAADRLPQNTGRALRSSSAVSVESNSAGVDSGGATKASEPRALKPQSASDGKTPEKRSTGTVQMFISVLSSLAIVMGLLLGAAWCYRRASPTMSGGLPKQVVQVLGRTPLAPRQQLVLLRFGHKLILVSNLHGEVRTISEITDPLEVDRMAGLCESAQPGSISESFRSVLHNIGRNG